jgi:hypothetical protein
MVKYPAKSSVDILIEDFFKNLLIQNQYYSRQKKQPILLIGEKDLYKAIKQAVEKANNLSINTAKTQNTNTNQETKQFKPLSYFSLPKL